MATTALVGVLAGCGGGPAPAPPTSPTPTAATTPAETALERQSRLDYEAAEKSYRAFRAEYRRVLAAGGAKKPTKVMTDTAGGPYLAELMRAVRASRKLGYTAKGTEKSVYIRQGGYEPKALILDTCEDGRGITIYDDKGKKFARGDLRTAQIEVRKVDGHWKLWSADGEKVASCG